MTIAEWCLLGAVVLYLATVAPAKAMGYLEFDNASPREPSFYEHPVRKRALGAHINGIETFPFFATAVVLAQFRQAPQYWIDGRRAPSDTRSGSSRYIETNPRPAFSGRFASTGIFSSPVLE